MSDFINDQSAQHEWARNRNRQYAIDTITNEYTRAAEFAKLIGNPIPDAKPFLLRAAAEVDEAAVDEVARFIAMWILVLQDLSEPDETPAEELSPGAQRAVDEIDRQNRRKDIAESN